MDEPAAQNRVVRDSQLGHNATIIQGDNHLHLTQHEAGYKSGKLLATLRATDPWYDKERLRDGLLVDSYRWVLDNEDFCTWRDGPASRLLWIKGDPGKGKTMLLCGIIDELEQAAGSYPMTYFFCQAADVRLNTALKVVKGLIYRLLKQKEGLQSRFCDKYAAEIHSLQDPSSWYILCDMLRSLLKDPDLQNAYVIVDALDECTSGSQDLLRLIAQLSLLRIRVLVSSRNWPSIEDGLSQATQKTALCLELHAEAISSAVQTYIKFKVACLTRSKSLDKITQDSVRNYLMANK